MKKKNWEVLWQNRIEKFLDDDQKFLFSDMNLLLNAYEQWRYEQME